MLAYTQLTPIAPLPAAEMVTRPQWIEANVRSMRPVLDRVGSRMGGGMGVLGRPARAVTRALMSAQVGGLTGFLAQRVLGQYDMPLLDTAGPPRLLMVGPNLGSAAHKMEADGEELLRWVTLHEITHAVQFGSVPWLRLHLAALVREVVDTLEVRIDGSKAMRLPSTDDLRSLVESLRRGELVTIVIGRERRVLVDRIQATMALIEGHAEHVMDAIGAEVIPSQAHLRDALVRRRQERSGPMRLLERILGFELKLRQYRDGKQFCDDVVERVGIEGLNRAWTAPHAFPPSPSSPTPTPGSPERLSRSSQSRRFRTSANWAPTGHRNRICNNPGRDLYKQTFDAIFFVVAVSPPRDHRK